MVRIKDLLNLLVENVKTFYSTKRTQKILVTLLALIFVFIGVLYAINTMLQPVSPNVDTKEPNVSDKEEDTETDKEDEVVVKEDEEKSDNDKQETDDKPKDSPALKPAPTPKPDPKPTPKPKHEHTWTAVYKDHPETYKDVWVDPVYHGGEPGYFINHDNGTRDHITIAELNRDWGGSMTKYMRAMGWATTSSYQDNVLVIGHYQIAIDKPAWRELTHYVCNYDGATKNP